MAKQTASMLVALLAFAGWTLDVQPDPVSPCSAPGGQEKQPGTREFSSPESCKSCHPMVYERWSRGMHRYSYEDPIFQVAYAQAYTETSGKAARTCLRCHAPVAYMRGDLSVSDPKHRQGVQCDFCHGIESVDLSRPESPFVLRHGSAKAGPHADPAQADGHDTWHQPLLKSALLCAGCHEYVVGDDIHIMSTWSEWKESSYAEAGTTCQHCHMPTLRNFVDSHGAVRELNDHNLSGGHSSRQIRKAGRLTIESLKRRGEMCTVEIAVENVGSGHCLPTGMPSRRVVLEVELLRGDQVLERDHRVYRKIVGDEAGLELTTDAAIKLHGRRILADNRIRPGETRLETFHFRVDPAIPVRVSATLIYSYSPLLLKPERIKVTIGNQVGYMAGDG